MSGEKATETISRVRQGLRLGHADVNDIRALIAIVERRVGANVECPKCAARTRAQTALMKRWRSKHRRAGQSQENEGARP
jgi:hypothetical protein